VYIKYFLVGRDSRNFLPTQKEFDSLHAKTAALFLADLGQSYDLLLLLPASFERRKTDPICSRSRPPWFFPLMSSEWKEGCVYFLFFPFLPLPELMVPPFAALPPSLVPVFACESEKCLAFCNRIGIRILLPRLRE